MSPNNDDDAIPLLEIPGIRFVDYKNESQLEHVMSLVGRDLSEPYSIFTYRYFLHRFPQLCILAVTDDTEEPIGCVVGKIDIDDALGSNVDDIPCSLSSSSMPVLQPPGGHETHPEHCIEVSRQHNHHNGVTVMTGGIGANETNKGGPQTGYIGMLAVTEAYRRRGIGQALVQRILRRMKAFGCESATLETEVTNISAQKLYQDRFGFIREELLVRYYLNWNDAYRLRLWF